MTKVIKQKISFETNLTVSQQIDYCQVGAMITRDEIRKDSAKWLSGWSKTVCLPNHIVEVMKEVMPDGSIVSTYKSLEAKEGKTLDVYEQMMLTIEVANEQIQKEETL